MKRLFKIIFELIIVAIIFTFITASVSAAHAAQDKWEYSGDTVINSGTNLAETKYTSTIKDQNALLVSGGSSTIQNPTVVKSGDGTPAWSEHGINSGILVYNGATLTIKHGSITTSGSYSPGLFAYGATVRANNTAITTSQSNSHGLMLSMSANVVGTDLTIKTTGEASSAIRSAAGGGNLTLTGGDFSTTGSQSPAIYSLASTTIKGATITADSSAGLVVEGANSVSLTESTLQSADVSASTPKNIFLYQSASTRDAPVGTTTFSATDSKINTVRGDTFYITNATVNLTLKNNIINNASGAFLRAEASTWGEPGINGGTITLAMTDQTVKGDIILDDISSLNLTIDGESNFVGAINHAHTAKNVSLAVSADTVITLTGNSYVDSFKNTDPTNYNIHLNGYSLEVGGVAITSTYTGEVVIPEDEPIVIEDTAPEPTVEPDTSLPAWVLPVVIITSIVVFAALASIIVFIIKRRESTPALKVAQLPLTPPPSPAQTAPGSTNSSPQSYPPVPPPTA